MYAAWFLFGDNSSNQQAKIRMIFVFRPVAFY